MATSSASAAARPQANTGCTQRLTFGSPRVNRSVRRTTHHLMSEAALGEGDSKTHDDKPTAASRPELFHRLHMRHKLIEGDLGPLLKTRRFIFLKVRFAPM